ncbi:MAG: diaminopimelate decarboxylase [Helicobacter sp.]|nr:diaminopimelate decarboxylase [Helicobacter sp.]
MFSNDEAICNIAKEYKTPFYLYDLDRIRDNFLSYSEAFKDAIICYALKANSNLSILKMLANLGAGADCVSGFEIQKALISGIEPSKIIFSGVGKTRSELELALKSKILLINIESEFELFELENIAKELKIIAPISIRVNPNIDAKTHPFISTGLTSSKFGLDILAAEALYLYAKKSEFLLPIGLQFHIGSQILDIDPLMQAALKMRDFAKKLLDKGIGLKFLDIGGGVGIAYGGEEIISLTRYAKEIKAIMGSLGLQILCEPGRRIVGDCGILVGSVLGVKKTPHKNFVITDCAMNDLMRPALYDAKHRFRIISNEIKDADFYADIVGPVCESGDFLAKNVSINAKEGDLIAFYDVGAYGFSMSHNYNLRPRAAEIGSYNSKIALLRKREDFAHLLYDEATHGF